MSTTHSNYWSVNRPHLQSAAQLLATFYPGLKTIRIKESDFYNRIRIRITIKAQEAGTGNLLTGTIRASRLDQAVSRIIQRIDSQPELRKAAIS